MTGVTYTEILIFDSVLVESLSEWLYTEVEHTLLFIATLSYEQIIHLFVSLRVVEEFAECLLRSVVTCAEDTEVCEEVKRLKTYEHSVATTHRKT